MMHRGSNQRPIECFPQIDPLFWKTLP